MIEYKKFSSELIDEVYEIYEANKWENYLNDKERLSGAFERSVYILGAFENDRLVGFVRCVGDSEYILYVQDLIVKPSHQRKGIGRELIGKVSEAYPDVRQFVLITDRDDEVSNSFYKAIGLSKDCNGYPVNAYFRAKTV